MSKNVQLSGCLIAVGEIHYIEIHRNTVSAPHPFCRPKRRTSELLTLSLMMLICWKHCKRPMLWSAKKLSSTSTSSSERICCPYTKESLRHTRNKNHSQSYHLTMTSGTVICSQASQTVQQGTDDACGSSVMALHVILKLCNELSCAFSARLYSCRFLVKTEPHACGGFSICFCVRSGILVD